MKRNLLMVFVLVGLTLFAASHAQVRAEVALRAAMEQETVQGDVKGAIEAYRKIVDAYPKDRAVQAQALLRMAGCYQNLGDAQAREVYAQLVREYGEFPEAVAVARAALSGRRVNEGALDRQIWRGQDVPSFAAPSADGLHLAYIDYARDELVVRDLRTGRVRGLVTGKQAWGESYVSFSPDGRSVAYAFTQGTGDAFEQQLRVVSLDTTRQAPNVRVLARIDRSAGWLGVYNWSADGRWIAVQLRRGGHGSGTSPRHEIGVVNVATGELRIVTDVGPRLGMGISLSPDSRYVAFDSPAGPTTAQRDIRIVSVRDGKPVTVNAGPEWESVVGWSADGEHLLYTSEKGGVSEIWAQGISAGEPAGRPVLVRSGVTGTALGVTRDNSIFFRLSQETHTIHIASVDMRTGAPLGAPPVAIAGPKRRNTNPRWSPDGRHLAFISSNATDWGISERVLSILSDSTGQLRTLPLKLGQVWTYDWSPDGRSFLARATDFLNRMGLYRVDALSGEVTPVVVNPEGIRYFKPLWRDATTFYYTLNRIGVGNTLMLRDIVTGSEEAVLDAAVIRAKNPDFAGMRDWTPSPDGRFVAGIGRNTVWLISVGDGAGRQVFTSELPIRGYTLQWAPDGSAVFVTGNTAARRDVWRLPVQGMPVKLDLQLPHIAHDGMSLHPDGTRIAVQGGLPGPSEIRVLDKVLPVR